MNTQKSKLNGHFFFHYRTIFWHSCLNNSYFHTLINVLKFPNHHLKNRRVNCKTNSLISIGLNIFVAEQIKAMVWLYFRNLICISTFSIDWFQEYSSTKSLSSYTSKSLHLFPSLWMYFFDIDHSPKLMKMYNNPLNSLINH